MNQSAKDETGIFRLSSISERVANALVAWSLVWGLAVGTAVWLAAIHELEELLDDALQSSSELLALLIVATEQAGAPSGNIQANDPVQVERFAWQVTAADGHVLMHSVRASANPWHRIPKAGFSELADWRIYGLSLGKDGRMLYTAQTQAERHEVRFDIALVSTLAALTVGLLGYVWLRARVRAELKPLNVLSRQLASWDFDTASGTPVLGTPERIELEPVHRAIEALASRLSLRIANERAFSSHAAHALRTPLAGIDAQLAVAIRECPAEMQDRLQRVRGAATRLQGMVAALLGLFRAGESPQRVPVDVSTMLAKLPTPMVEVHVTPNIQVMADQDLLAAALLNLLDNAARHGASNVYIEPVIHGLRVRDDGPGIDALQRDRLQQALDSEAYENFTGLGLMMASRVARAHGGKLVLAAMEGGLSVELHLGST